MNKIDYNKLETIYVPSNELILRPINEMDTEQIIKWRNTEDVKSHFIFREPITAEMHTTWLKHKVYTGKVIQFIIEIGSKHTPIGSIYIRDINEEYESGEFGIFIGEANYRAKGYGTLAIKTFIPYCFSLGLHRIYLRVLDENKVALNSYLHAGFVYEGTARDMVFLAGHRHDVVFMSLINKKDLVNY